ncbi:MAG: phage holin family protein [Gemmatimonadota bacterium]|nr:phage holin family protein [Gemmatimonadota bacterium]
MAGTRVQVDPDTTLGDLVGRLTDDGKRLIGDEIRLAKLELGDNLWTGAHGIMWLALGFGIGVVALVSLTVLLTAGFGRLAGGNVWAGALITAALEMSIGGLLVMRGLKAFGRPSYTLGESREELKATKAWLGGGRAS